MDEQYEMALAAGLAGENGETAEQQNTIPREAPDTPEQRKALVKRWQKEVRADKAHHAKAFKKMREDMQLAAHGADEEWVDKGNYVVPIIQRHINQSVAQLYAKNPKATAKRKQKVDFTYWDGDQNTLQQAMAGAHPMSQMILDEVGQVQGRHQMLDKLAKTLELLFNYFITEQQPDFKMQVKQMVRRAKTCGVGYVKLGFQRAFDKNPDVMAQISDVSNQIARIESLLADAADDEIPEGSADLEELRLSLQQLQEQEDMIVREGPIFDFPRSTEIIPDRKTRQLRNFVGARWVTHEFHMTVDEVKQTYEVDVSTSFTPYDGANNVEVQDGTVTEETYGKTAAGDSEGDDGKSGQLVCVWEVYDKANRQTFTLVDGYPEFVKEPRTPTVNTERFWPFYALVFNEIESEKDLYPPSDVRMLKHAQMEYNRSREGLRQHRIANKPKYFVRAGILEDQDVTNLATYDDNAIIPLNALEPQTPINSLIQPHQPVPLDPNLYETGSLMDDVLRTVGTQEANLGGQAGGTATESSIAENSRMTSMASNTDDLDELLTELAQSTGQVMLLELDGDMVRSIAGQGAPWPEMSRQEIVEEVFLEVKAGSSGRPNKAAELANLERGMPYLLQMPNVNPTPLVERYLDLLEIDYDDAILEGLPSITAMNSMAGKGEGEGGGSGNSSGNDKRAAEPDSDPNQQGEQGSQNAPSSQPQQAGPQPAMPDGVNNMSR